MKRRDFLRMTAAAMFTAASSPWSESWADDLSDLTDATNDSVPLDENIVAIFSDTHTQVPITTHQPQRLIQCVKAVLNMNPRPANLLIYGDVAYLQGRVEEYQLFKRIIAPIDKAGIKWEAAMGNHDRLKNFYTVFPERREKTPPVVHRYVHVVKTPRADFILLDSYMEGQVRGEIRPDQRAWLEDQLKAYAVTAKSVFVGCHHPIHETGLQNLLASSPNCAGFIHGHWHRWSTHPVGNLPTLCFGSTGHWGDCGYALAHLSEKDALFVPYIDAFIMHDLIKKPIQDVPAYLKQLNEKKVRMSFRVRQ